MRLFVSGALLVSYLVCALFFLKFRRDTGDRLFGFFAAAFALLALQRIVLTFLVTSLDELNVGYVLRLLAFVLILVGIVDRNRGGGAIARRGEAS